MSKITYPKVDKSALIDAIINLPRELDLKFGAMLIKHGFDCDSFYMDKLTDEQIYKIAQFLYFNKAIKLKYPLGIPTESVYW